MKQIVINRLMKQCFRNKGAEVYECFDDSKILGRILGNEKEEVFPSDDLCTLNGGSGIIIPVCDAEFVRQLGSLKCFKLEVAVVWDSE